jgi:hypothetical protein
MLLEVESSRAPAWLLMGASSQHGREAEGKKMCAKKRPTWERGSREGAQAATPRVTNSFAWEPQHSFLSMEPWRSGHLWKVHHLSEPFHGPKLEPWRIHHVRSTDLDRVRLREQRWLDCPGFVTACTSTTALSHSPATQSGLCLLPCTSPRWPACPFSLLPALSAWFLAPHHSHGWE